MILDMPFTVIEDKGSIYFDYFTNLSMMVNVSYDNLVPTLDKNKLYEVRGSLGAWQFRFGDAVYLTNTNTYIYNVQWNNNVRPQSAGLYNFRVLASEKKEIFGRTFCMIGDSITWWERGGDFRNLLRTAGLKYDFAGFHVDPWGFRHCGSGGFNTQQTLDIFATIPTADTYFILLGTNDQTTAQSTYDNLMFLVQQLRDRDACARIYLSTLLPRNDQFNALNNDINTLIKNAPARNRLCIVDSGKVFTDQQNFNQYLNDGIHPNAVGYNLLVNGIVQGLR